MFRKMLSKNAARQQITIDLDGVLTNVEEGESVAAVLLRSPPFFNRTTPVTGKARAPFCMMGACFDCLVDIDGQTSVRSCLVRVTEGMKVARQKGRPDPISKVQG